MPIKIHGKTYITVAERVKELHSKENNFSITTEVLTHTPVVVKATLTCAKGTFTGISYANYAKEIEKVSPYEVAETSAVGRALGFAGYGLVDDIATADEMIKAGVSPSPEISTKKVVVEIPIDLGTDLDDLKPEDFKPDKAPLRDTKGKTFCSVCGKAVPKTVEVFSLNKYKKILCFDCQKKELKNEGYASVKDYEESERK
jgi:hypothetical protein